MHLQLHTTGTEHFVRRTDVKLHIRDIELTLVAVLNFADLLLPVTVHLLAFAVTQVFLLVKQIRRGYIYIANLRVNDVIPVIRIVLHGGRLRVLKLHRSADSRILFGCRYSRINNCIRRRGCGGAGLVCLD